MIKARFPVHNWLLPITLALTYSLSIYSVPLYSEERITGISITANGEYRLPNGVLVAKITNNGYLRDRQGRLLGRILKNGYVTNPSGVKLGYVDEQGKVKRRDGKTLGVIHDNGRVVDSKGRLLTTLPNINKTWIAIYVFFNLM